MPEPSAFRTPAPLLTGEEVAEILGVTPRTVRQLAADGKLHRIALGHRITRYSVEDINALIERSTEHQREGG